MVSDFRAIDPRDARVVLVEAGDRILSTFPVKLSEAAEDSLKRLGVDILRSKRVTSIELGRVMLGPETIEQRPCCGLPV